jgi:hypothetical protein
LIFSSFFTSSPFSSAGARPTFAAVVVIKAEPGRNEDGGPVGLPPARSSEDLLPRGAWAQPCGEEEASTKLTIDGALRLAGIAILARRRSFSSAAFALFAASTSARSRFTAADVAMTSPVRS